MSRMIARVRLVLFGGEPELPKTDAVVMQAEHDAIAAHRELAVASAILASTVSARPFSVISDFADLEALLDRRWRRRQGK